jgi:hypothetical protein
VAARRSNLERAFRQRLSLHVAELKRPQGRSFIYRRSR